MHHITLVEAMHPGQNHFLWPGRDRITSWSACIPCWLNFGVAPMYLWVYSWHGGQMSPNEGRRSPRCFHLWSAWCCSRPSQGVFPGTFAVSGLAGSMVIIQVLTQTSQEKEEISSTSCLFLPVVAQATWTQLLRPRIPHRPVSLQHPWPSRSPLHLWSFSHFPIWVEIPPLTFAPDLKLQTIPVSAHCFSSPTWSIWAKSRLPVSYLECSSDFLTSQAQTDSFTEPPRSSALGPAYLPVALPLCLLSTSSVL